MKVEIESPTSAGVFVPYIKFTSETIEDGFSLGLMYEKLKSHKIEFACLVNSDNQNYISVAAHKVITKLMGGFTTERQTLKYEAAPPQKESEG